MVVAIFIVIPNLGAIFYCIAYIAIYYNILRCNILRWTPVVHTSHRKKGVGFDHQIRETICFKSLHLTMIVVYFALSSVSNSIFDAIRCQSFLPNDNTGDTNSCLLENYAQPLTYMSIDLLILRMLCELRFLQDKQIGNCFSCKKVVQRACAKLVG